MSSDIEFHMRAEIPARERKRERERVDDFRYSCFSIIIALSHVLTARFSAKRNHVTITQQQEPDRSWFGV